MGRRGGKTEEERRFDAEVGRRIELLRVARRVTQRELAKAAKLESAQLYSYESGGSRCPPFRLRLIASYLDVEVGALIPDIHITHGEPQVTHYALAAVAKACRVVNGTDDGSDPSPARPASTTTVGA
jgi:transcriptional regulator with XRE-family HTH domain